MFGERTDVFRYQTCAFPEMLVYNQAVEPSLFRREAWERAGGYCETFTSSGIEDWDLWITILELGYRADASGEWSPAPDAPVDDPLGDLIRAGKLRRGMTDEQVRAALGQRPATVQRFASRGGVSELWVFPDLGVSVLLSRRQCEEPRVVVDFSGLPAIEPP